MNQEQQLIVYTKSWCGDCHRTKRLLDNYEIPYQETVGLGNVDQCGDRNPGPPPEILDRGKWLISTGGDNRRRMGIGKPLDHAQAKPNRKARLVAGRLQRAIPARGIGADRAQLDAMVARIAHDLGRGIEAHRLAVQ